LSLCIDGQWVKQQCIIDSIFMEKCWATRLRTETLHRVIVVLLLAIVPSWIVMPVPAGILVVSAITVWRHGRGDGGRQMAMDGVQSRCGWLVG
jgi:hypothetical protein